MIAPQPAAQAPAPAPKPKLIRDLERLPSGSATHLWADYMELRAMTSSDGFFSRGFLFDTFDQSSDIDVNLEEEEEEEEEQQDDEGEGLSTDSAVEKQDAAFERRWQAISVALGSRHKRMKNAWPFELVEDRLYLRNDPTNNLHQLYLMLLLSSTLRYVNRKRMQEIADNLEAIGAKVFGALMPSHWKVESFGKNSTISQGTKQQKLTKLADQLRAVATFRDTQIKPGDSGDAGLDLVAWHVFGDSLGQMPIAFAQCGCSTTDVEHKQFEATPASFNRWMVPDHPAAAYYIAPLDYRSNNGDWERRPAQVIFVDRARIIHISREYSLSFGTPAFLQEALQTHDPMAG